MKKRLVSALLALSMLCSAVPAPAFAQGADSAGLEQEQCSCSIRCTADGMNPDCPVCAADAAACGAGLDPATVETADPEPTPEPTATPVPEQTPAPAGEPAPQTLGAVPSLLAANDGASTRAAASLTKLVVGGTTVVENSQTTENTSGQGWSYDVDSNTLTLDNATINGTDTIYHVGAGIFASGDLTIVLEGSSTVTGVQDPNGDSQSIRVEGNLTIQGGGSLTAQGAETSSGSSYGIFVIGSFTQQGGSVTASGGNINGNYTSTGLYVYGSTVTVQGGTLTATGGTTGSGSYGISANGSVTVSDATVTATGGTGNYSYGLHIQSSSPSVTISGSSSLTARSGTATNRAGGIYFQNPFGSTGSVTVGNGSTLLTNSVILYDNSFEAKPLTPTGNGSWLIYGQSDQTSAVGGNYTLEENITIESGNTLTIPAGSTLTVPQDITLTNNGTLNIANQSSLAGDGTLAGNGTFNLTNPEPVISGSETLTYDGTDQFSKFKLEAPSGTVTVMGKDFTISSSPSLDGWNLGKQEIINAGTYTLTASHTDGRTIQKQVTVSKATSSISINDTYNPGKTYDGTALANPTESQLTITGAGYNDVTFTWYKGSVDEANKLDSAPTDAGTYYLVASIPESNNTSGSEATSGAITISPATISIASATVQDKTYDGTTTATVDTVTFDGLVNSESLTINTDYTATAAFTDKSAGDSKQATVTVTLTNANYTFGSNSNTITATANIAQRPVVLSWSTPISFTYDGSEHSVTASITNAVNGDDVGLDYGTSTTTATAAKEYSATVSGLSGSDASNYTLAGVSNTTQAWSITTADSQLGLTVDKADKTYTYGETITFTVKPEVRAANGISLLAADTVTFKVGDTVLGTVSVTEGAEATFAYNTNQKGLAIGANTVTATYTGGGNLNGTTETVTVTLNAKTLTAAITGNTTKTYDGTTAATGLSITLNGVVSDDAVTAEAASYAYDSANAGENKTITASGITLSGADARFYTVNTTATIPGNITKANAAVTKDPTAVENLVYTGQPQTLVTAGEATGGEMQYSTDGASYSAAIPTGTNAGDYTVFYYVQGDANHSDTAKAQVKVTIAKADPALAWTDQTVTYTGEQAVITAPTVTLVNGETYDSTFTYQYKAEGAEDFTDGLPTEAGSYTVRASMDAQPNYNAASVTMTLTIEKAAATAAMTNATGSVMVGASGSTQLPTLPEGAGYGTPQAEETYLTGLDIKDGHLYYTGTDAVVAGSTYTATVPVTGAKNYKDYQITVTLTGTNKLVPTLTVEDFARDYTGKALTLEELTKSAVYDGTPLAGSWAFAAEAPKNAGEYSVELVFTPDDAHYAQTSVTCGVTINKLDATVAVELSTNRVEYGQGLPGVNLVYTGVLKGESLAPDSFTVDGMPGDSTTAGTYAVALSQESQEAIQALADAKNYDITFTGAALTVLPQSTQILPAPEVPGASEDEAYRLEQSDLTVVPEELNEAGFNSVDEIQDAMYAVAVEALPGVTDENTELHDVTLLFSKDGGKTWIKADKNNFPANGITVTLPYPDGTNAADYDFVVTHMATVAMNGLAVGAVETPAVTKTADGLRFTVKSLSPVAVSWKLAPKTESSTGSGESTSPAATPAPMTAPAPDATVYYTCPACGHHDWTATDEGYRCDTCGYVESLKQLTGYGNVKGVYEPKTGSNTAGGHAVTVPQTGDTSNPVLWLGLLLLSGLALGGITLYRRKKTQ